MVAAGLLIGNDAPCTVREGISTHYILWRNNGRYPDSNTLPTARHGLAIPYDG